MNVVRTLAVAAALSLVIGCSGGGSSGGSSVAPPAAPTPTPTPAPLLGSSAAAHILAAVNQAAVTSPQPIATGAPDDGGEGELQLPSLGDCGNGSLSNNCAAWIFAAAVTSSSARRPLVLLPPGQPPVLNFCRDAGTYPRAEFGPSAQPVLALQPGAFSLAYVGSQAGPIGTFVTRQWVLDVQNTFAQNALTAPAISVTPTLSTTAGRGWIVFFSWTWPADVLLVPYSVNEIQLAATSAPLGVPAGSSANLRAFDCLGRPLNASATGAGVGFDAAYTQQSASSTTAILDVPVFASATSAGTVVVGDDAGARASVHVLPH